MRTTTTLVSVSVSAAAVDQDVRNPERVIAANVYAAVKAQTSNPIRVKVFVRQGNGDAAREFVLASKGA